MKNKRTINPYEYIAFSSGFALLSFELVASRILAPAVGSSIYVWTSIIGVIIAALAAGYNYGGKLADKRVTPLDITWLLLGSSAAITVTMLGAPVLLDVILSTPSDPRVQGMVASVILFAPASFLLGAISPYLARLKNLSVKTTGTTIASLSVLNSIGGITGTFSTGFVFFSYIGSRSTLVLIIIVLLGSSWLIKPRQHFKYRLLIVTSIIIVSMLALVIKPAGVVAIIDTPSASYRISDIQYNGRPIRALAAGPGGLQSGVYRNGSDDLVFGYTQKMADLVAVAPVKESVLILGGGSFTLPQHLAKKYPNARIDVVEIDPELANIARKYFNYKDPANVRIITQDARIFLNNNTTQYDIVLVDVYNDDFIPFTLASVEYAKVLRQAVKPSGLVAVNVIASNNGACGELLSKIHGTYNSQFPASWVYPVSDQSLSIPQNIVLAYGFQPREGMPSSSRLHNLPVESVLSDDFAPVEYLQSQC